MAILLLDNSNNIFKVQNVLFSQDIGILGGGEDPARCRFSHAPRASVHAMCECHSRSCRRHSQPATHGASLPRSGTAACLLFVVWRYTLMSQPVAEIRRTLMSLPDERCALARSAAGC